ncbi:MAG TPA: HPr(Ser) kinase/phosphatase [Burkholderiaceae bacterium]|nr:HPr(Ser) kinase/phosphatase [Burkholderiaceae bacterium]
MPNFQSLFETNREALQLEWLAGRSAADKPLITPATANLASPDLVGFLNPIHPARLHVLGQAEVRYYSEMDPARWQHYARELQVGGLIGLIVAENLEPPEALKMTAESASLPMLRSPLPAATVIEVLRIYFAKLLAQHCTMHGVFMDVLGMGVLISGESSVGKSELGLELISRGHGLVADDVVDFSRVGPDTIEGRCPHLLANLLEVRGLGLLDIKAIFGETAVRRKMKLRLIVELRRYGGSETFERLPLEGQSEELLGLPIRKVLIPVASGRNLAVLTEAAVRNTILQLRGIDTMGDFLQRQQQQMSDESSSP